MATFRRICLLALLPLMSLVAAFSFGSSARANRCDWNQVSNDTVCCDEQHQAIWNPIRHAVMCVESESGDSCAWNDIGNRIGCCETDEHAIWNPIRHAVMCYEPVAPAT